MPTPLQMRLTLGFYNDPLVQWEKKQSYINSSIETVHYRGQENADYKTNMFCDPVTIGTTKKVYPADLVGSPRKIPSSSAFKRNKEQTCGCTTIRSLNVFLVPFVALIDEWQPRNIKEWKGGRGRRADKENKEDIKGYNKGRGGECLVIIWKERSRGGWMRAERDCWVFWSSLLDH